MRGDGMVLVTRNGKIHDKCPSFKCTSTFEMKLIYASEAVIADTDDGLKDLITTFCFKSKVNKSSCMMENVDPGLGKAFTVIDPSLALIKQLFSSLISGASRFLQSLCIFLWVYVCYIRRKVHA